MGIIAIKEFNTALLAKWCWQWSTPSKRLWKTIFQTLYCGEDFQGVKRSKFFSTELFEANGICNAFTLRILGKGDTVTFWSENWGRGVMKGKYPELFTYAVDPEVSVREVKQQPNISSIVGPVLSEQASTQLACMVSDVAAIVLTTEPDDSKWIPHEHGQFSVKSVYFRLCDAPRIATSTHRIWKLQVQTRFKVFAWLLCNDKILTAQNLRKRGFHIVGICYMCRASDESTEHLFNSCLSTRTIHEQLYGERGIHQQITTDTDLIAAITDNTISKRTRAVILTSHFVLWRKRCNRIFNEKISSNEDILSQIREEWSNANGNTEAPQWRER